MCTLMCTQAHTHTYTHIHKQSKIEKERLFYPFNRDFFIMNKTVSTKIQKKKTHKKGISKCWLYHQCHCTFVFLIVLIQIVCERVHGRTAV